MAVGAGAGSETGAGEAAGVTPAMAPEKLQE